MGAAGPARCLAASVGAHGGSPLRALFHGTAPDAWAMIQIDGLLPMRRQFVRILVDRETALMVGRRKER